MSSYQRCMSKRYHYLLDSKDAQFVDYVNLCFGLTATVSSLKEQIGPNPGHFCRSAGEQICSQKRLVPSSWEQICSKSAAFRFYGNKFVPACLEHGSFGTNLFPAGAKNGRAWNKFVLLGY